MTGMRRKILFIIFSILVIVTGFLIWMPVRFEIKKEISVNEPVEYAGSPFTDLRQWKNWNVEIRSLDSSSMSYSDRSSGISAFLRSGENIYTITETNPAYVQVRADHRGIKEYHFILAVSDSIDKTTRLIWIRSLPFIGWLKEKLFTGKEMDQSLKNLKYIIEDSLRLYGFPISIEKVKDSLVVTKVAICANKDKILFLGRMYYSIFEFAKKKEIPLSNCRMANFSLSGRDSIRISAGIPTTKKGFSDQQISILEMPSHGRMLVGHYEGPYSGLGKLYAAMERYSRDKRLLKVAMVYEKYLTDPKSAEDSLHMRIEIYFPIL
jgi:effector-binding domain-containing protein